MVHRFDATIAFPAWNRGILITILHESQNMMLEISNLIDQHTMFDKVQGFSRHLGLSRFQQSGRHHHALERGHFVYLVPDQHYTTLTTMKMWRCDEDVKMWRCEDVKLSASFVKLRHVTWLWQLAIWEILGWINCLEYLPGRFWGPKVGHPQSCNKQTT